MHRPPPIEGCLGGDTSRIYPEVAMCRRGEVDKRPSDRAAAAAARHADNDSRARYLPCEPPCRNSRRSIARKMP